MKNNEFNSLLIETIANDKAVIHTNENSFVTLCSKIEKQHTTELRRQKIVSRGILPIVIATMLLNIGFLFFDINENQTMTTFAEENYISTSAYYFSEILINE
ncbi:MAG: hypothetical protein IJ269_04780 [Bacteroidales bacterium]|nr:hypothetical protein [Bacteroidales bacterium]